MHDFPGTVSTTRIEIMESARARSLERLTTCAPFTPTAGYEVSLLGFDIATWQGAHPTVPVKILSGGGVTIFDSTISTNTPLHNALAVNSAYFADGIILRWGPNGYNVGVDNIRFDVRAIDSGSAVPEPATWAMMIAGFGLAGGAIRTRRRLAGLASA